MSGQGERPVRFDEGVAVSERSERTIQHSDSCRSATAERSEAERSEQVAE
jgi:hypothetical protein